MCVFPESQAPVLHRCAPDPCHKHINFDDFHGSAPGPNEELSENHDFRAFAMAAQEKTQMLRNHRQE